MPGDFDKISYDQAKHNLAVLIQQGRVNLPSVFNESVMTLLKLIEGSNRDEIGKCGSPNDGFRIGRVIPIGRIDSVQDWRVEPSGTAVLTLEHFDNLEGKSCLRVKHATKLVTAPNKKLDLSHARYLYFAISRPIQRTNKTPPFIQDLKVSLNGMPYDVTLDSQESQNKWDIYKMDLTTHLIDLTSVSLGFEWNAVTPEPSDILFDFISTDYTHPIIPWNSDYAHPYWVGSLESTEPVQISKEDLYLGQPILVSTKATAITWNYKTPRKLFYKEQNGQYNLIFKEIIVPIKGAADPPPITLEMTDAFNENKKITFTGTRIIDSSDWRVYKFTISLQPNSEWVKSISIKNIPAGCHIGEIQGTISDNDFVIVGGNGTPENTGKFYCNGKQCLKEFHETYLTQLDYPNADPIISTSSKLVYLDCWELEVSDPSTEEIALKGADAAIRLRQMSQVRCTEAGNVPDCTKPFDNFKDTGTGRLSTLTVDSPPSVDPCAITPLAGYNGDNRLFRVEIHQGGNLNVATFKWSKDNGSIETSIIAFGTPEGKLSSGKDKVWVESLGRDKDLMLKIGDYIEITDDDKIVANYPKNPTLSRGDIRQITDIDVDNKIISWAKPDELPLSHLHDKLTEDYKIWRNAKIIKWDGFGTVHSNPNDKDQNGNFLKPQLHLDNGIILEFIGNGFRTGDYRIFKAREDTREIDKLFESLPVGPIHHYCKLSYTPLHTKLTDFTDCRVIFPPLTEITASDVLFDNSMCQMKHGDVKTVQQALEVLCKQPGCLCSATVSGNSASDIQQAIDAVSATGGVVCIPKGVYEINSSITIRGNGITIVGEGIATRLVEKDGSTLDQLFIIDGASNIVIRDILVSTNGGRILEARGDVTNLSVERCTLIHHVLTIQAGGNAKAVIGIMNNISGFDIVDSFIVAQRGIEFLGRNNDILHIRMDNNKIFCRDSIIWSRNTQSNTIYSNCKITNNWFSGIPSISDADSIDVRDLNNLKSYMSALLSSAAAIDLVNSGESKFIDMATATDGIHLVGSFNHVLIQNNKILGGKVGCCILKSFSDKLGSDVIIEENFLYSPVSEQSRERCIMYLNNIETVRIYKNYILSATSLLGNPDNLTDLKIPITVDENDIANDNSESVKLVKNIQLSGNFENVIIDENILIGQVGLYLPADSSTTSLIVDGNLSYCTHAGIVGPQIDIQRFEVKQNLFLGCVNVAVYLNEKSNQTLRGGSSMRVIEGNGFLTYGKAISISSSKSKSLSKDPDVHISGNFVNLVRANKSENNPYGIIVSRDNAVIEDNLIYGMAISNENIKTSPIGVASPPSAASSNQLDFSDLPKGGILIGSSSLSEINGLLPENHKILLLLLLGDDNVPIRKIDVKNTRNISIKEIPSGVYRIQFKSENSFQEIPPFIVEPGVAISLVPNEGKKSFDIQIDLKNIPSLNRIQIRGNRIMHGSQNGITLGASVAELTIDGNTIEQFRLSAIAVSSFILVVRFAHISNNYLINCCNTNATRIPYSNMGLWNGALVLGISEHTQISKNMIAIQNQAPLNVSDTIFDAGIATYSSNALDINENMIIMKKSTREGNLINVGILLSPPISSISSIQKLLQIQGNNVDVSGGHAIMINVDPNYYLNYAMVSAKMSLLATSRTATRDSAISEGSIKDAELLVAAGYPLRIQLEQMDIIFDVKNTKVIDAIPKKVDPQNYGYVITQNILTGEDSKSFFVAILADEQITFVNNTCRCKNKQPAPGYCIILKSHAMVVNSNNIQSTGFKFNKSEASLFLGDDIASKALPISCIGNVTNGSIRVNNRILQLKLDLIEDNVEYY